MSITSLIFAAAQLFTGTNPDIADTLTREELQELSKRQFKFKCGNGILDARLVPANEDTYDLIARQNGKYFGLSSFHSQEFEMPGWGPDTTYAVCAKLLLNRDGTYSKTPGSYVATYWNISSDIQKKFE